MTPLEAVRARGRAIVQAHPPGPERTALLREVELEHRRLRAELHSTLGPTVARAGIARGPATRGTFRPSLDYADSEHVGTGRKGSGVGPRK
jgi:hypothetical protein